MSGVNAVNIKPITQRQAQKLWRCGIPLLWKGHSCQGAGWRVVDYSKGSPRTQVECTWYMQFGVEVE